MISNVDIVYIKFVALNKIYELIVDIFIWDSLEAQMSILNYYILKSIFFYFFNNVI